jgi:hypothetical protein
MWSAFDAVLGGAVEAMVSTAGEGLFVLSMMYVDFCLHLLRACVFCITHLVVPAWSWPEERCHKDTPIWIKKASRLSLRIYLI